MFDGTNIIVIGQGNDLVNGASKNDTWVKKYTVSGSELNAFVIPDDNATLVKIDSGGNYYFSSGSSTSALFRKYNSSGVQLSSYAWNSKSPYIYPPSYIMDGINNVYMYGYASNLVNSASGNDWIIRKFDSSGVEQ
jgi:Ca2+-binding RTX toxin-like protein